MPATATLNPFPLLPRLGRAGGRVRGGLAVAHQAGPEFVRCDRPRCRREAVIHYDCPDAPEGWRGWLCEKHRDELYRKRWGAR